MSDVLRVNVQGNRSHPHLPAIFCCPKDDGTHVLVSLEEWEKLQEESATTATDFILEILEHSGLDAHEARAAFWSALTFQKISLDKKRRVARVLDERLDSEHSKSGS